ncbi:hypothetical protein AAE478_009907 [Parahypoxylon ruwenzoriense]
MLILEGVVFEYGLKMAPCLTMVPLMARISFATYSQSPPRILPTLTTMSILWAPALDCLFVIRGLDRCSAVSVRKANDRTDEHAQTMEVVPGDRYAVGFDASGRNSILIGRLTADEDLFTGHRRA